MTNIELKNLRVECGLSQSEMAQLIGVGFRTYQGWESARRKKPIPAHVAGLIKETLKALNPVWLQRRLDAIEEFQDDYEEGIARREAAKAVPLEQGQRDHKSRASPLINT
jgi:transcriptional regulator with XRE-family HTH domain